MTKAKLQFPDALRVIVVDSRTGERLSRIAVMLTVYPSAKNAYRVLAVTDQNGVALFSRELVKLAIDRSRRNFLMDYEGELEDCSQEVEIEVLSQEDVQRAIGAMERYKKHFEIDPELLESPKTTRNEEVQPAAQRLIINAAGPEKLEMTMRVLRKSVSA